MNLAKMIVRDLLAEFPSIANEIDKSIAEDVVAATLEEASELTTAEMMDEGEEPDEQESEEEFEGDVQWSGGS